MVRPWSVIKTVRPEWLRDGKINLLVQYALARHPELARVPAVVDLAQNEEQRQVLGLYASGSDIGRSIVAPPGVPAETVSVLRSAFMAAMRDPAFNADVAKSGIDVDPLAGERLREIVRQAVDVPPQVVELAKRFSAVNR
jgi:tripartite-type tricarboxylate transporter receptor subunit TctC